MMLSLSTMLLQLSGPAPVTAATPLAPAATTTVRLSTIAKADFSDVVTKKWFQLTETPGGSGAFVTGPATPPNGVGSYYFSTGASGGGQLLATIGYTATKLSDITRLTYKTYISPTSANNDPVALNIGVDFDGTDGNFSFQGRLVFVPSLLSAGVWQSWDALANSASWYATFAPFNTLCSQATPCTWAAVLSNWPNAVVHSVPTLGWVGLKLGNNGHSADVAADTLTVGVSNADTTYDFEPEIPCTTVCYVNDLNGNDAFGGDTAASAKKSIQAGVDQVQASGQVVVAAGTYSGTLNAANIAKSLTLRGAGAGTNPAVHTIISSTVAGDSGVFIAANVQNVNVNSLRVIGFDQGGICAQNNNNGLTITGTQVYSNTTGGPGCQGGISANGPVDNVLIDGNEAFYNTSRGIVIWDGFKTHITITNNIAKYNNCCGIELQDGSASGVLIANKLER